MSRLDQVKNAIKDAGNPFLRLINNVTGDNSSVNVPYFQSEQVKEAAFQSQNACEMIHKGLHARLETSTDDIVIRKTLDLCKMLLLEGPNPTFQQLMFTQSSGKVLSIANTRKNNPDQFISKESVLEGNIHLAAALHKGIVGDRESLAGYGLGQQTRSAMGTAAGPVSGQQFHKSDFQSQQEREQKNFKKRREEERARSAGIVTTERQFEQFDATLAPQKLVDYALNHPKKKFADEELENFVEAVEDSGKVEEVCACLDKVLRDGKSALQNRYKVLTIVDVMIRNLSPALAFFEKNNTGIYRHVALEAGDNPTKSAMMQQLSTAMMDIVHGRVKVPASASSRGPSAGATTSAPVVASASVDPQQQMNEMMEKMKAMQAQILQSQGGAAAPAPAPVAAPAPAASTGWGDATSSSAGGWGAPSAAATSGGWGDATATSASGWGASAAAAPVAAPPQPPKRDVLDDLFDTSVPAPTTNTSTFGFMGNNSQQSNTTLAAAAAPSSPMMGNMVASPLAESDMPMCPNNSVNASSGFAKQLLQRQLSVDYTNTMADGGGEGNGFGVNGEYGFTTASDAVKAMLAAQQQQGGSNDDVGANPQQQQHVQQFASVVPSASAVPSSVTTDNIAEQLKAMAAMQQQFSLQSGNNTAVAAAEPPAASTPLTSHIVSPVAPAAPAPMPAATTSESDAALQQMQQMQQKMNEMMAAMQRAQQQQQHLSIVGSNTAAVDAENDVYSPTAYYKDPYSTTSNSVNSAISSSAIVANAVGVSAVASPTSSKKADILRLMATLEEQMSETRSVLAAQQGHMKSLQEALMREM